MKLSEGIYLKPDWQLSNEKHRIIISKNFGCCDFHVIHGDMVIHFCESIEEIFRDKSNEEEKELPYENLAHMILDLNRRVKSRRKKIKYYIYADKEAYMYIISQWLKFILPNYDKDATYDYINACLEYEKLKNRIAYVIGQSREYKFKFDKEEWDKFHKNNLNIKDEHQNIDKWKNNNIESIGGPFLVITYLLTGERKEEFKKFIESKAEEATHDFVIEVKNELINGLLMEEQIEKVGLEKLTLNQFSNISNIENPLLKKFFGKDSIISYRDITQTKEQADLDKITPDIVNFIVNICKMKDPHLNEEHIKQSIKISKKESSIKEIEAFTLKGIENDLNLFEPYERMLLLEVLKNKDKYKNFFSI